MKPATGSTKTKKRLGRGEGSGSGGTASRGHKGAKSRSGYSKKSGFEGGQMPLQRRVPKFGFKNPNRVEYKAINLDLIQALVDAGRITDKVTPEVLVSVGVAGKNDLIKVLGRGVYTASVEIVAHKFSQSAIDSIEKAGGKAITE